MSTRIGIAVVEEAGRFLVGTRGEDGPLAGYAEFPGGKCRDGETPAACALRECLEETALRVDIVQPLLSREYDYPHGRLDLSFFLCRPIDATAERHGRFRWVVPEELARLTFPPANDAVIQRLLDRWPPRDDRDGAFA